MLLYSCIITSLWYNNFTYYYEYKGRKNEKVGNISIDDAFIVDGKLYAFSKIVNAETSKKVDVITDVKIQNDKGEALTGPLGRYDTFRLNAKFAIGKRGTVKAGDTTEVKIDSPMISNHRI